MKYIIIFLLLFFAGISVHAQEPVPERIKAQKVAFITNQLNLTSSEAQQFWPYYNAFDKKVTMFRNTELRSIRQKMRGSGNSLSDTEANALLNQLMEVENEMHIAKVTLVKNLKTVISAEKILKLKIAEEAFNKKLLELLQNRKEQLQKRVQQRKN